MLSLVGVMAFTYLAQQALYATWVLYTTYRFGWGPRDQGISLAFFGAMTAIFQEVLTGDRAGTMGS